MASGVQIISVQSQDIRQPVAELLSRALFTAKTLRQTSMVEWMKRESQGYGADDALPAYRCGVSGELVAWMPGHGWIEAPVDGERDETLGRTCFFASINELEKEFLKNRSSGGLRVDFSEQRLREVQQQTNLKTRLALAAPAIAYAKTLETVRGVIRLWSADLLELGVTGMPTSDRETERQAAASVCNFLDDYIARSREEAVEWAEQAAKKPGFFKRMLKLDH